MSHGMVSNEVPVIPGAMRRLQMYVKKGYDKKIVKEAREKDRQARCLNKVIKQMNLVTRSSLGGSAEDDSDGDSVVSNASLDSITSMASMNSVDSVSSGLTLPGIHAKSIHSRSHRNKIVSSARILWTLMPTPNLGVVIGYMNFHTHATPASSIIKYWCVLVDKCLSIFKNRGDTKPARECINLTACHFLLNDKDMIRIYRVSDRQVWFCMGTLVHKRHDWISWIEAACSHN
jgi:hypothetical protein